MCLYAIFMTKLGFTALLMVCSLILTSKNIHKLNLISTQQILYNFKSLLPRIADLVQLDLYFLLLHRNQAKQ